MHRLRVRLYVDRLDIVIGSTWLINRQRDRACANSKQGRIVDYRHVMGTPAAGRAATGFRRALPSDNRT
jgi:hypothetical protein